MSDSLKPSRRTVLVTHRSCLDGTGSALMFLWAGGLRSNVMFRNPSGLVLDRSELPDEAEEVWYVDCCPTDLLNPAAGLPFRVFDHHVSNARLHTGDARCTFDMSRSGTSLLAAMLGWNPDEESPLTNLVHAFEDYDLARFENQAGMRLADIASTYEQEQLLNVFSCRTPLRILQDGELSARADGARSVRELYCEQASRAAPDFRWTFIEPIGSLHVALAAMPRDWKNQTACLILDTRPAVDLVVVIDAMGSNVSFRSRPGGPDCSVIAGLYGGGGHATAAAFKCGTHRDPLELMKGLLK